MKKLYQILVPTVRNNGKPIRTRFHRVWDGKIREVTGGLSIVAPIKGQWICGNSDLYAERMIPVNIACTEEQMEKIVEMTAKYYEQKAIMYYVISEYVKIVNFDDSFKKV